MKDAPVDEAEVTGGAVRHARMPPRSSPTRQSPRGGPGVSGDAPGDAATLRVGLLLPLSGPSGLYGPSGRNCAQLAAEEINARGGVLGRPVKLIVADGGMSFPASAREGLRLVDEDGVSVLIGTHASGVRDLLAPALAGRVPYIYTPIFEGGDPASGVFYLGETAYQQLGPALPWMARAHGVRRWFLVGNDYSWPRDSLRTARRVLGRIGGVAAGERMLPLGTEDFAAVIDEIDASGAQAVVAALVGSDAVIFHRAFARAGLDRRLWRLGLLTEENTLLGVGADCSARLMAVAGYFANLDTPENRDFTARYTRRFGPHAPQLNSIGQSCYEGLIFLAGAAAAAGSLSGDALARVADGLAFDGPRGRTWMDRRHLVKDIHLAEARGIDFEIVKTFPQVRAMEDIR